jgi:hypothetical protein
LSSPSHSQETILTRVEDRLASKATEVRALKAFHEALVPVPDHGIKALQHMQYFPFPVQRDEEAKNHMEEVRGEN